MRLICGLYAQDGRQVTRATLATMAAGMVAAHLTPEVRVWTSGSVGLAVIDFAAPGDGSARLVADGGSVLAADCRLDARDDLATRLGVRDSDDDGLITAAVARWDHQAPVHLLGDFALAHWDPARNRLLCARDIFGVRPLHYAWRPGELFAFASFPSGLHTAGLLPRTLDRPALAFHFVQRQEAAESLFQGVARLPAGHVLEVSAAGLAVHRFWAPDARAAGSRRVAPEIAAAELRVLVEQAVRDRLPRAGTVAAHLSGGLDSSAIAVLAARQLRERGSRLHAWSFLEPRRADVALDDESAYVQAVLAQEPDIAWTPVPPPPGAVYEGPFHPDYPLPLGPEEPENAVCIGAATAGATIILSGWGGDEGATFNGRGALAEMFLRGRWRTLASECSALKRVRRSSFNGVVRREIVGFLFPAALHAFVSRWRAEDLTESLVGTLSTAAARHLKRRADGRLRLAPDARTNRVRLLCSSHIAERCESWAAQGAYQGLAFAFPLLDRRIVEYALSLPSDLYLRDGWRRRVFRDAMTGILPEVILGRHAKSTPFPSMSLILAEQKPQLAARVETLAAHAGVRDLLDIDRLRARVVAIPTADDLIGQLRGNATPTTTTIVLRQALRLATFVERNS